MTRDAARNREYERAARLLGRKLGLDWRTLPREQVEAYMRKLEIADSCWIRRERKQRGKPI